jgi:hypothetical protein
MAVTDGDRAVSRSADQRFDSVPSALSRRASARQDSPTNASAAGKGSGTSASIAKDRVTVA